jgi:hypothetical protein
MEDGAAGFVFEPIFEPQPALRLGLLVGELPFVELLVGELPQPSNANAAPAPRMKNKRFDG